MSATARRWATIPRARPASPRSRAAAASSARTGGSCRELPSGASALDPREPVARPASIVGDGQDPNRFGGLKIDDVVREALYRNAANLEVGRYLGVEGTRLRKSRDPLHAGVDSIEESLAEAGALPLEPPRGIFQFAAGFRLREERLAHREAKRAWRLRRTSDQGTPGESPARTRRARRSTSSAHRRSTSAGSSVSSSSRLSNSSAATSARSFAGSFKASSRTESACAMVMGSLPRRAAGALPRIPCAAMPPLADSPYRPASRRRAIGEALFAVVVWGATFVATK